MPVDYSLTYSLQLNISFNDKTEVFEYPSVDQSSPCDSSQEQEQEQEQEQRGAGSRFKANTSVGSSGTTNLLSFHIFLLTQQAEI